MKRAIIIIMICLLFIPVVKAKVDLVTLPGLETVQLTIYNSADLTLVRESRALTLKKGNNQLQFSWANTLIDPTSLEMKPLAQADRIDIFDLTFPPRVKNLGLWNVQSGVSGKAPVEITFMTSGISWRAFYMGTLTPDEKTMRLQGYVRVTNNSGEDYENAQTRLIVGKVHILDQIAALAKRQYPYGRPGVTPRSGEYRLQHLRGEREVLHEYYFRKGMDDLTVASSDRPKEITKEGLSEYFLYTIEGTETIPNGYAKRLPSFEEDEVPVVNLYKYEEERYGNRVMRFLSFDNDEEHKLGETPIPGGLLKVYRREDKQGHLSYAGQSNFKYIPVNEEVELNLGAVRNIVVEPKLMNYRTENYQFNGSGNIIGWDEVRTFRIAVKNTRALSVKVEIKRNFKTSYWEMKRQDNFNRYEKYDRDTARFSLQLAPRSKQVFTYVLTTYHGTRQSAWRESEQL